MMQQLNLALFQERTGITHHERGTQIVSLRQIVQVRGVEMMSLKYLRNLLHSVTLKNEPEKAVYQGCDIDLISVDPRSLRLGQTFVERSKCQGILESLANLFSGYCVAPGFNRSVPMIVYGKNAAQEAVISHYLPPVIEDHKGRIALLDGIHRNYLVKSVGTTIDSIVIRNPNFPLPFDTHDWSKVRVVTEKPPKNERFRRLRQYLFRDFTGSGIDG